MSGVVDSRSAAKMDLGKQPRCAPYESTEMKLDNGCVNRDDQGGTRKYADVAVD